MPSMIAPDLSRRTFLALAAAAPLASAAPHFKQMPIGLELYSVRDDLQKDLTGTVRAVAKMGYQCVEFYAPYMHWTPQQAKDMRALMDDLGIRCYSTHNGPNSFVGDGLAKATELNQIIGSKYIVMASANRVTGLDGWKAVADTLSQAAEKLKPQGIWTRGTTTIRPNSRHSMGNAPWKCWRPTPARTSCCNSTSATASKPAPIRLPGSSKIPAASSPCI